MQTLYRRSTGRLTWLQMRDHGTGSAALLSGTVGCRASAVVRGSYTEVASAFDRHRAEGYREYGAGEMVGLDVVFPIRGNFPSGAEFALRNRVSDRLEALLMDTGLGVWTGASGGAGGAGEMEISFDVVDGPLARHLIAEALGGGDAEAVRDIRLYPPERFGAA
jgi:hypothetical protein